MLLAYQWACSSIRKVRGQVFFWVRLPWAPDTMHCIEVRAIYPKSSVAVTDYVIAYDRGAGATPLPFLCLFAFLTGLGSSAAFSGSIKTGTQGLEMLWRWRKLKAATAAMNWPNHRGTATAFPLAGFGLSAFFFATISRFAFPDNTTDFLLLLASGTFTMAFVGFLFLRVVHHPSADSAVPAHEGPPRNDMNLLQRTKSRDSRHSVGRFSQEPGRQSATMQDPALFHDDLPKRTLSCNGASEVSEADTDETSSLMSKSSTSSSRGTPGQADVSKPDTGHDSHHLDIRGLALLSRLEFWDLFLMMGVMCGIGLMTIK